MFVLVEKRFRRHIATGCVFWSLFTIFFVADFSAETGAGKAKSTAKASFGAHF